MSEQSRIAVYKDHYQFVKVMFSKGSCFKTRQQPDADCVRDRELGQMPDILLNATARHQTVTVDVQPPTWDELQGVKGNGRPSSASGSNEVS